MIVKPQNKWLAIEPIDSDAKVGSLFVPSSSVNGDYKTAKVIAVAEDVDGLVRNDVVLYDSLGQVAVRMGDKTLTFVKAVNVVAVVSNS